MDLTNIKSMEHIYAMKRLILSLALLSFPMLCMAQSPCASGTHCAVLSWTASTTPGVSYSVWRASGSCPADFAAATVPVQVNTAAITALSYVDTTVTAGTTYCYAVTAVLAGVNSAYSPDAQAVIPGSFPPAAAPTVTAQ